MLPRDGLTRLVPAAAVLLGLWLPAGAWAMAGMGSHRPALASATPDELRPSRDRNPT